MKKTDDVARDDESSHRERFHDVVVDALGRRIVSGETAPGSLIGPEQVLCDEFGTSRTVIREAVKILSAKGILESIPRSGTRVMPLSSWHLLDPQVLEWRLDSPQHNSKARQDLHELRAYFEPSAAELAARRSSPQDHQRMKHALLGMALASNSEEILEHDLAFHKAILTATGNTLFQALGALISTALRQVFTIDIVNKTRDDDHWIRRHQDVYEAIARREPETARAHMMNLLNDVQALQ
jgi:DNA-binding FadR family transcriptional regulator